MFARPLSPPQQQKMGVWRHSHMPASPDPAFQRVLQGAGLRGEDLGGEDPWREDLRSEDLLRADLIGEDLRREDLVGFDPVSLSSRG